MFKFTICFRGILSDTLSGKFYSSPGMDGWMLTSVCAGMTNAGCGQILTQLLLNGVLRAVGWGYRQSFYGLIASCKAKRDAGKKLG